MDELDEALDGNGSIEEELGDCFNSLEMIARREKVNLLEAALKKIEKDRTRV